MDILHREILPLFEGSKKNSNVGEINTLIQTATNEYSLYVNLTDIYHRRAQNHEIHSTLNEQTETHKKTYNIPIHYHEIILRGKGVYYQNAIINIYSLRHPKFLRVNTSDLLYIQTIPEHLWISSIEKSAKEIETELISDPEIQTDTPSDEEIESHKNLKENYHQFLHLSGETLKIGLPENQNQLLQKIPHHGLPVPKSENLRGHLYVCLLKTSNDPNDPNDQSLNLLMDLLNYHQNSNVNLPSK